MRVVLVHGFNVKDGGAKTVDRLGPYLIKAGYNVDQDDADYGYFSLLMVRFRKHLAVLRVAEAIEKADAVIAHSNGANYVLKALRLVRDDTIKVIFLSPAANRKAVFAESASKVTIFFTRSDFWVWISGFLPKHPWGRMGQQGYKGDDPRVENVDFTDVIKSHSDWFSDDQVEFVSGHVIYALEDHDE